MFEAVPDGSETVRAWLADPPTVTAVVVSHNGARWLPHTLDGLLGQAHRPDMLVAVDVASRDASVDVLADRLPADAVIRRAAAGTSFGEAVQDAVQAVPRTDWVWLLHDDSAPAPEALACLLDEASTADDITVVGPKIREWPSLRRLLEVGVTLTGTGQRETGLETGEPDQGQHDRPRDVLAVSSAGMLARRDAWDALGGFDPALPTFCDDIDFGWRAARAGGRVRVAPPAVLFHLEAGAKALREDPLDRSVRRARRRAAVFTLLANASRPGLVWQTFRLLFGTLLRVLGLLLAKSPRAAVDDLAALGSVYAHPLRLAAARRRRARTATMAPARVRRLLPHAIQPYQHGLDSTAQIVLAMLRPSQAESGGRRAVSHRSGHVAATAEAAPAPRVWARYPWLTVLVVLAVLAVVAARGVLGSGTLSGGALLPSPESARAWWSLFFERSHDVGVGSSATPAPYVLPLALVGSVAWARAGLVVDVLMLGSVVLAALTAHRFARTFLRSRALRIWWAVTYALLIPASGALAQGRIGTVAALVLAPLVAGSGLQMLTAPSWQPAVRTALWVALATAFAPLAYLLSVGPLVSLAILSPARRVGRRLLWILVPMVLPFAVCGQWMTQRALDPGTWWWEAGRADAGVGVLDPSVWQLALGRPDGSGGAPAWIGLGLVVAGVFALLRRDRRTGVLAGWVVALVGLALAALGAGTTIDVPGADQAPVWVGLPLVLWLSALAAAAAVAADNSRDVLPRRRGALLRPVTAIVVLAALAPVAAAGWWVVQGDAGPLDRGKPTDVPAYLAARAATGSGTLVVRGTQADGVGINLFRGDGTRLGDESVAPTPARSGAFEQVVTDVLSNPSTSTLDQLAGYGVGAIYLSAPADEQITTVLDAAPLLSPSGSPGPRSRVWTLPDVDGTPARSAAPLRPWIAAGQLLALAVLIVLAAPARRAGTR